MSFKMLAPVVVNPEILSKKASVKEGIDPVRMKGIAPKKEMLIHPKATIASPSFTEISSDVLKMKENDKPIPAIKKATSRNERAVPSL